MAFQSVKLFADIGLTEDFFFLSEMHGDKQNATEIENMF